MIFLPRLLYNIEYIVDRRCDADRWIRMPGDFQLSLKILNCSLISLSSNSLAPT